MKQDGLDKITVYVDKEIEPLMGDFIIGRKDNCQQLQRAIDEKNFSDIKKIGHILAGVCGGYGFYDLGKLGEEIENYARLEDLEKIINIHFRIKDYLEKVDIVYT